jgi:hypothetical protein
MASTGESSVDDSGAGSLEQTLLQRAETSAGALPSLEELHELLNARFYLLSGEGEKQRLRLTSSDSASIHAALDAALTRACSAARENSEAPASCASAGSPAQWLADTAVLLAEHGSLDLSSVFTLLGDLLRSTPLKQAHSVLDFVTSRVGALASLQPDPSTVASASNSGTGLAHASVSNVRPLDRPPFIELLRACNDTSNRASRLNFAHLRGTIHILLMRASTISGEETTFILILHTPPSQFTRYLYPLHAEQSAMNIKHHHNDDGTRIVSAFIARRDESGTRVEEYFSEPFLLKLGPADKLASLRQQVKDKLKLSTEECDQCSYFVLVNNELRDLQKDKDGFVLHDHYTIEPSKSYAIESNRIAQCAALENPVVIEPPQKSRLESEDVADRAESLADPAIQQREDEEGETSRPRSAFEDPRFYVTFWSLMYALKKDNQLTAGAHGGWIKTKHALGEVLEALSANDPDETEIEDVDLDESPNIAADENRLHKTRYCTERRTFKAQMMDKRFRRQMLTHILVVLHALASASAPNSADTGEPEELEQLTERAKMLLGEASRPGSRMSELVSNALNRESDWHLLKQKKAMSQLDCDTVDQPKEPSRKRLKTQVDSKRQLGTLLPCQRCHSCSDSDGVRGAL